MKFSEYVARDATQLAELVARREVGANELLDLALAQHECTPARINVIWRQVRAATRLGGIGGRQIGCGMNQSMGITRSRGRR